MRVSSVISLQTTGWPGPRESRSMYGPVFLFWAVRLSPDFLSSVLDWMLFSICSLRAEGEPSCDSSDAKGHAVQSAAPQRHAGAALGGCGDFSSLLLVHGTGLQIGNPRLHGSWGPGSARKKQRAAKPQSVSDARRLPSTIALLFHF